MGPTPTPTTFETATEEVPVPFEATTVDDPQLDQGATALVAAGVNGVNVADADPLASSSSGRVSTTRPSTSSDRVARAGSLAVKEEIKKVIVGQDHLLERLRAARTFRAASFQMRQLGFAAYDLPRIFERGLHAGGDTEATDE